MSTTIRRASVVLAAAALFLGAASCTKEDSATTSSTTSEAPSTTAASNAESAATARFDKNVQQELKDVGCYEGAVDGILGPESDAAIVAFQKADGITADGELGPVTDAALSRAVSEGRKVCGSSTSTTSTPGSTTTTAKPTTTAAGGGAACTAQAISAALGGGKQLTNFVCADGWAAGSWTDGQEDGAFILQAQGGTWKEPAQTPCGTASAGVPPVILQDGCVS